LTFDPALGILVFIVNWIKQFPNTVLYYFERMQGNCDSLESRKKVKTSINKKKAIFMRFMAFMTVLLPSIAAAALSYSAGIKGGINIFTFTGKDAQIPGVTSFARIDNCASLFICSQVNQSLSVQAELAYVKKGRHYNLLYDAIAYRDSFYSEKNHWSEFYKFDYIQIPLLLKLCPAAFHFFRFQLYAGPAVNFLFSAKEVVSFNDTLSWIDISPSTTPFDCSVIGGITAEIPIGPGYVLIDFRYDYGFISTARVANRELEVDPSAHPLDRRNNGIALMVGYAFTFNR
jgi:hypothetical protein